MKTVEDISSDVLDLALRIHKSIGPGLLESVYETVLAGKLMSKGYAVERQVPIDIEFEGTVFQAAFRADLLIDRKFLVEIKSVERLSGAHSKQLLTYLRLMKLPLGLVLNFGGETLREGVKRVVNGQLPFVPSRLRVNQIRQDL